MSLKLIKDLGMQKEKGCTRRWCVAECSYCGTCGEHRTQSIKNKKSCGCAKFLKARFTHGLSATRQYQIWVDMKDRCDNPKNKSYIRYGERGITYDPIWVTFEGFWKDMEEGYSDNLTIERKDNSLGYIKNNCEWVTIQAQAKNRNAINTFKKREVTSYGKKVTMEQLKSFAERYKLAKYGEKGIIVREVVKSLGIAESTAKIYLSQYMRGKLCKLI